MSGRNIQVAVIGDSQADARQRDFAYSLGRMLAEMDCRVINGGGSGVMEAVSRGAFENNGTVAGILPSDTIDDAHPYCTVRLATGMGHARNAIIALSADIIIAVGGKAGTLTEMGFGWIYGKPVIAVTGFGGWSEELAGKKIDDRRKTPVYAADSLEKVRKILHDLINVSPV